LRTTAEQDVQVKTSFSVGDYWKQAGIDANVVVIPTQRQQDREYRATFPAFELIRNTSDIRVLPNLHSAKARLPENNFIGAGGTNYPRYRNSEFDALIDKYQV